LHRFTSRGSFQLSLDSKTSLFEGGCTVSHYNGHTTQHTLQFSRNPLENSPFGTSQLRFDYLQQRSVPLQLTDHLMVGSSIAQSQQTKRMVAQLPRWELLQVNWFTPFALTAFEYEPSIYREQGSQYTDPVLATCVHRLPTSALSLFQRNAPSKSKGLSLYHKGARGCHHQTAKERLLIGGSGWFIQKE
jgi:hypothetical protein